eukprot:CAMPEP_0178953664 /NCGR_PEP_ID=MMETSP0789-20121207/8548_1 /TAXON_ID=3005 /ORGANISM="Rhizosolenia setigera, Strain CCMP 1694" /LENGTH=60 /DNA_ID=CAMNT_0020634955 /DNA_START=69 /DNA_END=251 /DNA_ORIENTATION=+
MADSDEFDPVTMAINALKVIFAMSPLIALGVIVYQGYEGDESESKKRNKKSDFELAGHGE